LDVHQNSHNSSNMGVDSQGSIGVQGRQFSLGGMNILSPHLDHTKGNPNSRSFGTLQTSHMK
jgi:hypothetical protein